MKKILSLIMIAALLVFTAYPAMADEAAAAAGEEAVVAEETVADEAADEAENDAAVASEETEDSGIPEAFAEPTGQAQMGESTSENASDSEDTEDADDSENIIIEPFIPDDITVAEDDKTILGSDDRVRIYNSWEYPYSAIAYLCMKYQCGCEATGTGFMVGRNMMLTAAHCIYCITHSSPIQYTDFYFGCNGEYDYCYTYNGNFTWWAGTSFQSGTYSGTDEQSDYAYIRFDDYNPGDTTGWFGMTTTTDSDLSWNVYQISAYKWGELTTNSGSCSADSENKLSMTMDTIPGNSGGPVYNSDNYAIGICISQNDNANYAYRISSWLIREMQSNGLIAD